MRQLKVADWSPPVLGEARAKLTWAQTSAMETQLARHERQIDELQMEVGRLKARLPKEDSG